MLGAMFRSGLAILSLRESSSSTSMAQQRRASSFCSDREMFTPQKVESIYSLI